MTEYVINSLLWSGLWFLAGCIFTLLLDPHLRDLWKK